MKILITGGDGYIAKCLYKSLCDKYHVTSISRKDLDLTNGKSVIEWFSDKTFDVVIHCAVKGGSRLKKETYEIADDNLKMYYNLLSCQSRYSKFIHFGSGAELYDVDSPYGLSKHVIRKSILEKNNFFNLRIFAVFNEDELNTRFIKSNIKRYIDKEPIQIHQDKYMDFIYMPDLIKIVETYIKFDNLPKEIDCVYNKTCSLSRIAQIINDLEEYKVEVKIGQGEGKVYKGSGIPLLIDFIGLKKGIKQVYEKLKNDK